MMHRVVIAAAVALFSLSTVQAADCSQLARWGGRGITAEFAARAPFVYAADGRGLTTYDVTDPTLIRQRSVLTTARPSTHVALSGSNLLLLTASDLQLLSLQSPATPFRLDTANLTATHLVGDEHHIVTAGADVRLWTTTGNQLQQTVRQSLPGPASALFLDGSTLYVASGQSGVRIFDVSHDRLDQIGLAAIDIRDFAKGTGSFLYAVGPLGLKVIDVSNPAAPVVKETVIVAGADFQHVAVLGSRLFIGNQSRTVDEYDISSPTSPIFVRSAAEPVDAIGTIGDRLLVAGSLRDSAGLISENGAPIRLFDLQSNGALQLSGEFLDYAGGITGVDTDGHYAFAADPPLMRVIDISGASPQQVASIDYGDASDRLRLYGRYAYVYGRKEVHVIDVSDPIAPKYAGVFHTRGTLPDFVTFAAPYLIESNRGSGFHVLDLSYMPPSPGQISGLKNDGWGQWTQIAGNGNTVYGVVNSGVKVVDLANPHAIKVARVIPLSGIDVETITVRNRPLMVLLAYDTLHVFDASDRLNPVEISSVQTIVGNELTADVQSGTVWVAAPSRGQIARVDLNNPSAPSVNIWSDFSSPTQIAARGGVVVIADRYALEIRRDVAPEIPPVIPQLRLGTSEGPLLRLDWTGSADSRYELQSSSSSDFATPESTMIVGTHALATSDQRFFRVRLNDGCSVSDWSPSLLADDRTVAPIVFAGTHRLVAAPATSGSMTIQIPLLNRSGSSATATLLSSSDGVQLPAAVAISAGAIRSLPVTIDLSKSGPFEINLAATDQRFLIELTRPAVTTAGPRSDSAVLILPGVGSTAGANGTHWKSALNLLCRAAAECQVDVAFAPLGDGGIERVVRLPLRAGEGVSIDDTSALFATEGVGVARIYASASSILASGYAYNDAPSGKFGQSIPAIPIGDASNGSAILGINSNSELRTNLGLYNPSSSATTATVHLLDGSGARGEREIVVPPRTALPLFLADFAQGELRGAIARIDASAPLIAYSSSVDQTTGDGSFSYASRTNITSTAGERFLGVFDIAGSTPGANGSNWKTSLQLYSPSGPSEVTLTFVPVADPTKAISKHYSLEAGNNNSLSADDVMATLFPEVGSDLRGAGSIRVLSSVPLVGWGRLYNVSSSGTFGQAIPFRDASPAAHLRGVTSERAGAKTLSSFVATTPTIFPVSDNDDARSNIGLVETAGKAAAVRVTILAADGTPLDVVDHVLAPYQSVSLLGYLRARGLEGLTNAQIKIAPLAGEGRVEGFASVVQNRSNDAITITAE